MIILQVSMDVSCIHHKMYKASMVRNSPTQMDTCLDGIKLSAPLQYGSLQVQIVADIPYCSPSLQPGEPVYDIHPLVTSITLLEPSSEREIHQTKPSKQELYICDILCSNKVILNLVVNILDFAQIVYLSDKNKYM